MTNNNIITANQGRLVRFLSLRAVATGKDVSVWGQPNTSPSATRPPSSSGGPIAPRSGNVCESPFFELVGSNEGRQP